MDALAAGIWIGLVVSVLLTWYGVRRSAPRRVVAAAIVAVAVSIPLTWSIGPLILALAAIQLLIAAHLQHRLRWWTVSVIAGGMVSIWLTTVVGSAVLLD